MNSLPMKGLYLVYHQQKDSFKLRLLIGLFAIRLVAVSRSWKFHISIMNWSMRYVTS